MAPPAKIPREVWEALDYESATEAEHAARLGHEYGIVVVAAMVHYWAKKLGRQCKVGKRGYASRLSESAWRGLDWNQSVRSIAAQTGFSVQHVGAMKKKYSTPQIEGEDIEGEDN